MRRTIRRASAAARRLLIQTGPAGGAWRVAYRAAARAIAWSFLRVDGDATVFVGGSVARGDVAGGLSDVDMVVVRGSASLTRLRRHAARVERVVPGARRQFLELAVCDEDELRRSMAATVFEPMRESDARVLTESSWSVVANLQERPGIDRAVGAWWRIAGVERRQPSAPEPRERRRLAVWLETQFWWSQAVRAALSPDDPALAQLAVKLVAEPARAWLWLEGEAPPRGRAEALRRGMEALPDEEPVLRHVHDVARRLHRLPDAPLEAALGFLVRTTGRIAAALERDAAQTASTTVALVGGARDLILPGGEDPSSAIPLADWRAVVAPRLPDEALVRASADPADPAALADTARMWRPGVLRALAAGPAIVLPAPPLEAETMLRAAACRVSDPVSFALLAGAASAEFPELPGWSAGDVAARAVSEHAAWLRERDAQPRRYLRVPDVPLRVLELARLLTAARAALFAESLGRGAPQLAVTVAAAARAAGGERLEHELGSGLEALRTWHTAGEAPAPAVVDALRSAVLTLPPYATRAEAAGSGRPARARRRSR